MSERQLPITLALGTTQTLAWASSYYLPAILADPIARELCISNNWFFAAFSAALVISGLRFASQALIGSTAWLAPTPANRRTAAPNLF
jgi:hypothetical protein